MLGVGERVTMRVSLFGEREVDEIGRMLERLCWILGVGERVTVWVSSFG